MGSRILAFFRFGEDWMGDDRIKLIWGKYYESIGVCREKIYCGCFVLREQRISIEKLRMVVLF